MKHLALLRGINIGPHKKIPMVELKEMFEKDLGISDAKTFLATGNVVFESGKKSETLEAGIEKAIQSHFGFEVPTQVVDVTEVEAMVKQDPFKGITPTKNTRLYATFVPRGIKVPAPSAMQKENVPGFTIIAAHGQIILSHLELGGANGTPEIMKILEKLTTKEITTRNWNTVEKFVV